MSAETPNRPNFEGNLPKEFVLQSCMCILQETLNEFFILRKISGWPDFIETETPKTQTLSEAQLALREKYQRLLENEKSDKENVLNFQEKCVFIETTFNILLEELNVTKSYENFEWFVEQISSLRADEKRLLEETAKKESEQEKLQELFENDREHYYRQIEKYMAEIGILKDEIEDFKTEAEIRRNFVADWQNSKFEMDEARHVEKQEQIIDKIEATNVYINREERVHDEIICAYGHFEREITDVLEAWKLKYQNDLKEMNEKIDRLREKYNDEVDQIKKLQELYQKREKEIIDYKNYKLKQEEEKAEMEKRHKAATKIQAWWRGTMVRKGFGQYKKKKDKKLKKKSSEKNLLKNL